MHSRGLGYYSDSDEELHSNSPQCGVCGQARPKRFYKRKLTLTKEKPWIYSSTGQPPIEPDENTWVTELKVGIDYIICKFCAKEHDWIFEEDDIKATTHEDSECDDPDPNDSE